MDFKLVSTPEQADASGMIVTLFQCPLGQVRGWYVGPIKLLRDGLTVPYVPPSSLMLGMVALTQAYRLASERDLPVYVVDPDKLWSRLGQQ